MGATPVLLMPVSPTSIASWASHTRRSPRSTEPGTDMFVPIGTPVYAPADGVIYGYGVSIEPATGRWVGIDFDGGQRFRAMHLSRVMRISGRVKAGELIGYSGASGYGYEDWSKLRTMPDAHVHVTLWLTQVMRFGYDTQGRPFTADFMNYVGGASGGGSASEEDDMFTDQDRANLTSVMLALGASDLNAANEPNVRTAVKILQAVDGQVNGLPDALKAIMGQVNGAPEVLADIRARVGVSDVQVKAIADAVVKQIGTPTVKLDYAAIAKAVNDDAARRMAN